MKHWSPLGVRTIEVLFFRTTFYAIDITAQLYIVVNSCQVSDLPKSYFRYASHQCCLVLPMNSGANSYLLIKPFSSVSYTFLIRMLY